MSDDLRQQIAVAAEWHWYNEETHDKCVCGARWTGEHVADMAMR